MNSLNKRLSASEFSMKPRGLLAQRQSKPYLRDKVSSTGKGERDRVKQYPKSHEGLQMLWDYKQL